MIKSLRYVTFIFALHASFLGVTQSAIAQQVPGALVPGRQQPAPPPVPKSTPGPATRIIPQGMPEGGADLVLTLQEITIEGGTAVPIEELQGIWTPDIGQEITIARLYDIAQEITRRYVDRGYAMSFATLPEQKIGDGRVSIRIVEGFIEKIVFLKGEGGEAVPADDVPAALRDMTEKIISDRPLNTRVLERYLLLMGDQPGIDVESTFEAAQTTEGASNLVIRVIPHPVTADFSTDNTLASSLDKWNGGITAAFNGVPWEKGVLQIMERCGIFCGVYRYSAASFTTWLGSEGASIGLRASRSDEKPGSGSLEDIGFSGGDKHVTLDASYPLIRSRQENLSLSASFDWSNSSTSTFAGILTRDRVRTLDLRGTYDFADSTGAVTLVQLNLLNGLPIMGSTEDDDPTKSTLGGSAQFMTGGFYLARNQPLQVWAPELEGFSLYATLRAQGALEPLLSGARCYYGGQEMGRGYDSGGLSGENCVMGGLEIRKDWAVGDLGFQSYGFGDAGIVMRNSRSLAAGEERVDGAQSMGVGLRLSTDFGMQSGLEVAWPLRVKATDDGKDSPRAIFTLSWRY